MPEIQTSMSDYIRTHAGLKYIFFGGKGGVGKTVFAAATALHNAQLGRRTMLASTNPVHSLSTLLGQNVLGKHTPVDGAPNLWAYEIETKETIERSKVEIREKIKWFLKFADISTKAEDFVESATMNPAFEESARRTLVSPLVEIQNHPIPMSFSMVDSPNTVSNRFTGLPMLTGCITRSNVVGDVGDLDVSRSGEPWEASQRIR